MVAATVGGGPGSVVAAPLVEAESVPAQVVARREDAVVVYANNEPIQLDNLGMPVHVLKVVDFVQLIGNGLVTNELTREDNPELVAAMVEAILHGLQDVIDDLSRRMDDLQHELEIFVTEKDQLGKSRDS